MKPERSTSRLREAPSRTLTARKAAEGKTVTARKSAAAQAKATAGGPAATGLGCYRERLDWRWLCRLVRALGVAPLDVEDVAQEVLLAAARIEPGWQQRPDQTPRQARRQLLRMVARWEVTQHVGHRARRRASRQRFERAEVAPSYAPSAEERLVERSRAAELHTAIDRLSQRGKRYATALRLHVRDEQSATEIAAALGISVNTAKSRLLKGTRAVTKTLRAWKAQERFAA
jgi:RNA polymerase sigma factor (sigma-70 family)